MKRLILLSAVLLAVSACTSTTPTNTNTPPNTNTSSTPTAETTVKDSDVIAKEKEIYDALKGKDPKGFGAMLADDFIYISSEGVYDKAGTIEGISGADITDIALSDWKVLLLDKDAAIVTYTVKMKGTSMGEPMPDKTFRGTSAWVKRGDKWMGIYHQETEAKEAPKGETMGSKETAKPATGAEAKPAAVTPAADPIARENQVWDALKKKDYDTFASFLAEDQLEVWDTGVNNKAASVEGVKHVNFAGSTLSDFKTVKFDDDATLVTYLAKGPSPPFGKNGERHATIWVNRGGKWWAVFHQGTTMMPTPPAAPGKK